MNIEVGLRATYERKFTGEDVRSFAELSGDRGIHHMRPDSKGRTMVQGLLTASLPTKLGGDMNYIARSMEFQFVKAVYVGDTVRCESVVTKVERADRRLDVDIEVVCTNQNGEKVLVGRTSGIVRT